jgi:6,7-dimethyl-8-ribityllumazine synthase
MSRTEEPYVMQRAGGEASALRAGDLRIGIVLSDYHAALGEALLGGALQRLKAAGLEPVVVARVPGAFEIPQAVSRILLRDAQRPHGMIALGVLVRGETMHFEILAREVCSRLQAIGIATGVPIGFGVLTVDSERQARDRAGRNRANKGWEAAEATLRMAALFRDLEAPPRSARPAGRRRRR